MFVVKRGLSFKEFNKFEKITKRTEHRALDLTRKKINEIFNFSVEMKIHFALFLRPGVNRLRATQSTIIKFIIYLNKFRGTDCEIFFGSTN